MATLFVARDAQGLTRFVGDVPRGAACGCFCPVCNVALVAKQGDALDWHFAHEAGMERPECRAGAMNLLRRLAVEELNRRGLVLLPDFSVPHPLGGRAPIVWTAHPVGELCLLESHGAQAPSATLPLREGGSALVFVCIDRETPPSSHGPEQAVLVAWCPYPDDGRIRTEAQARDFVNATLRLRWAALPDFEGRYAAAQAEAQAWMERLRHERAEQAGARWANVRRSMNAEVHDARPPLPQPLAGLPSAGPTSLGNAPAWAPGLLLGTSIHYRALDDETQWVCFQHERGQWRLSPVPEPFDGWDETFPPSIAVPGGPGWLRVVDFSKLLMLFNAHARASEIDSDPAVIARRFARS